MNNDDEIRGVKAAINSLVETLERVRKLLGREMEAYSSSPTKTPVVNAFHKAQVCTGHNIDALLELDMVLQDVLNERIE